MTRTTEMNARIVKALQRTWDAVVYDFARVYGRGTCISQEGVFEAVTDAGRLTEYGGDVAAARAFYRKGMKSQHVLLAVAFPSDECF